MVAETSNLDAIFCRAIEIAAASDRDAYLTVACGGDAGLRQRIDWLLDAHFRAGDFLETPPPMLTATESAPPVTAGAGDVVGSYQLVEQLGEGAWASSTSPNNSGRCVARSP